MSLGKTLIFIPTYNERDNAEKIARQILALGLDADLLFMDDHSPDGTGEILDALAREQPRLKVAHRSGKLGIGSAHQDAIARAYVQDYETLITMDCDFTHSPSYIRDFISAAEDVDVVIGSRYMRRDSLDEWNTFRLTLTRTGHILTRLFLGIPFDATGGYRLYRLNRIDKHVFDSVESTGYSFFFESLYLLFRDGRKIKEIPITLPARTYGTSKMKLSDALQSTARLIRLWRRAQRAPKPYLGESLAALANAPEWDEYWRDKPKTGSFYNAIAAVYRAAVIKRNLETFIFKNFAPGMSLLHAGCGSGQADADITRRMKVTALDISQPALDHYTRENESRAVLLRASAFSIPLPDASVDGVYNLGVMEHFVEADVVKLLREFRRVLKPGGRIVLFWPPTFGLSVFVLDTAHHVLRLFGSTRKLHPDEITRLEGRAHAERLLRLGGFRLVEYSFGPRDLFVQVVLVAQALPTIDNPIPGNSKT